MTRDQQDTLLVVVCMGFVIFCASFAFGIFTEERNPDAYNMITTTMIESTNTTETIQTTTGTTSTSVLETSSSITTTETTEATSSTIIVTEQKLANTQDDLLYLGAFTGTYYNGATNPCPGGSGRMLVSCDVKNDIYKGSVASRLVYETYGYYLDNKTMIYISFKTHPELDGWYSVDDCNAVSGIIDFYFDDYSKCPWEMDGLIHCEAWIRI